MTPQSPKTPLETFEAAADKSLLKLAVQCSPQIYWNNSDVEREQVWKEELDAIRQAAIAYGEAEVRAKLERLEIRVMSVGFREAMDTLKAELAALPNPDGGEVGK